MNKTEQYYQKVASHFDEDARLFEKRYEENAVLQKIRRDFRIHTEKFGFSNALEIGCGPGIDLVHFCKSYPEKNIYGIDLSEKMVSIAKNNLEEEELNNGVVKQGSVEDIPALVCQSCGERYFEDETAMSLDMMREGRGMAGAPARTMQVPVYAFAAPARRGSDGGAT